MGATNCKSEIEERQRAEAARRADDGIDWRPRLFRAVKGGPGGSEEGEEDLDWIINAKVYVLSIAPISGMNLATDSLSSDAPTPAEQVKQILNIAAILPGQKPDSKFNIPARRESELSRHESKPETHPHQGSASAGAITSNDNLIDLDEETSPAAGAPIQSKIASNEAPALTQDPPGFERPQLLKDIANEEHQKKNVNTSGAGTVASADLIELQDGLGNLQVASEGSKGLSSATGEPRAGLKRTDSETNEEDEFVDAES